MNSKNNKPSLSTPHASTDYVALTDICQPKQWKTIPMAELKETGYPVYGANGIIGYSNEYNHDNKTILIACRGASCGAINVCLPKSYVTGNAMCLDGLSEEFDLTFLQHYLQAYDFKQVISGSAQPQITRSGLNSVMVPILPTSSQRRISRILNAVDENRKQAEHAVNYLDTLIKSRFVEMFGDPIRRPKWPTKSLRRLCTKLGSGATPRGGKAAYKEQGIPLVRSMNVHNGRFVRDDLAYIDSDQAEKLRNVTLEKADVLLNITGASVARSCVLPDELEGGRVNQHVAIIRANKNELLPCVLNAALINDSYQQYLLDGARMSGATREAITKQDLENMHVPVPPIALQQEFAAFVARVDKLRFATQQQIDKLEMLKKSLLQEYFN